MRVGFVGEVEGDEEGRRVGTIVGEDGRTVGKRVGVAVGEQVEGRTESI